MKFSLPLLVLLALASPLYAYRLPATGNGALAKELQDILDLVPFDKVIQITKTYWTQDKDFQKAVKLMKGEHIAQWIQDLEAQNEFKDLLNWVQAAGLDIYELINRYHKDLGLPPLVPSFARITQAITGGLNGYIADISAVIPLNNVLALTNDKLLHSKVFREFAQKAASPETVKMIDFAMKDPHFLMIEHEIENLGVDKNTWETMFPFFVLASVLV